MKSILVAAAALASMSGAVAQNMPFITRVYDFMPAPGQFVNMSPQYQQGDTRETVLQRVEKAICGSIKVEEGELPDGTVVRDTVMTVKPGLISLGSYGGYVVFGFDHPVVNVAGEMDFQVFGNAFGSDSLKVSGGSCEPGIVMVSRDVNGNGLPDDAWYELAGSEYGNPLTKKHFTITYYKPAEDKEPVPDPKNPFLTDTEYVRWTSNDTDSLAEGYVSKNSFHAQSYWPGWAEGETLTFTGTKLRNNAVNENQSGQQYWVQYFFDWGYVDNRPDYMYDDSAPASNANLGFNIDWAVDDNGTPVHLNKVDFIKVYNGMLQQCGWLGETSTEVCGGIDLHPDAVAEPDPVSVTGDLNGDGKVDVADVNIIINLILGTASGGNLQATSDLNGDGKTDVSDVNEIINIILKV
ncbi:MAG: dockerin type I repeat-containing protein [Muribaculaceae bacterium]|nr:dockerin type I repeat-containing protein [Muribaculaceae bacterium]